MILRLKYRMFLVVLGITGFFTCAVAQQQEAKKFFVYIQNENGSPFYIREKDNTVLSSSNAGYIIIPQLSKGNYVFTIGLPGDQVAESAFEIHLNGDGDKGLLLREGAGQLALYSLKDFKEIQPIAVASSPGNRIVNIPSQPSPVVSEQPPAEQSSIEQPPAASTAVNQGEAPAAAPRDTGGTDAFSKMLDKIMGTTKKPAVATVPPPNPQAANSDSAPNTPTKRDNPGIIYPPVESHHPDSMGKTMGESQVVNNTPSKPPPSVSSSVSNDRLQFINFLPDSSKRNSIPATQAATNHASTASLPVGSAPSEAASSPVKEDTTSQIVMNNSDCQQLASEDFFQKIRRKMASRSGDEGIFRMAEKYFSGGACFSAQQIQSLTYLFMTDEYKFKFLELAYPHTYDTNHFPSLIKTLGNDYYRGRFKALVRQANSN